MAGSASDNPAPVRMRALAPAAGASTRHGAQRCRHRRAPRALPGWRKCDAQAHAGRAKSPPHTPVPRQTWPLSAECTMDMAPSRIYIRDSRQTPAPLRLAAGRQGSMGGCSWRDDPTYIDGQQRSRRSHVDPCPAADAASPAKARKTPILPRVGCMHPHVASATVKKRFMRQAVTSSDTSRADGCNNTGDEPMTATASAQPQHDKKQPQPSDIDIARACELRPVTEIGQRLDIPADALVPYGHTKAKISLDYIKALAQRPDGKLILMTGITPTPPGEGKTTSSVGLVDAQHNLSNTAAPFQ